MRKILSRSCAGTILAIAIVGSAATAGTRAPSESLDKLLIGAWDIRGVDDLDPPCSSTFYARFLPGGLYEDGETQGRYSIKGKSLTFIPERGGRRSTSTLVAIVSRDRLIWSNDDGRFGMRRCPN